MVMKKLVLAEAIDTIDRTDISVAKWGSNSEVNE